MNTTCLGSLCGEQQKVVQVYEFSHGYYGIFLRSAAVAIDNSLVLLSGSTGLGEVKDALDLVELFIADYKTRELDGQPAWMGGKTLRLRGNPWIMPPEAVVEEGLSAVETYLKDVLTAAEAGVGITTMQLLKVVFVGSSRAGKTRYNFQCR